MSKSAALVRVGVAYVIALAVAAAWILRGPSTGHLWADTLVADVLATIVVFVASRLHRNSSFYDAYWSVVPPVVLVFWWVAGDAGSDPVRLTLCTGVVVVWAVRLTANWVRGFPGLHHEDWRYPRLRERAGRFEVVADLFGIHLVPTLQVFLALLPAYVVATRPTRGWGWLDVVATVVGLAAVGLELVADEQMRRFTATARRGEVMDRGVWSWSRHPNYVGEFGFWVAILLFGVSADPGQAWWMWIGAAAMLGMLLGASIPMMEERSLERRPGYADVVARVSKFVPRPPRDVSGRTA